MLHVVLLWLLPGTIRFRCDTCMTFAWSMAGGTYSVYVEFYLMWNLHVKSIDMFNLDSNLFLQSIRPYLIVCQSWFSIGLILNHDWHLSLTSPTACVIQSNDADQWFSFRFHRWLHCIYEQERVYIAINNLELKQLPKPVHSKFSSFVAALTNEGTYHFTCSCLSYVD